MPDLADGESAEIQGSARLPYQLKNVGGVYSCSCAAWRNQSLSIERRTCKHLRQYRGEAAERERLGDLSTVKPSQPTSCRPVPPPVLLAHSWTADVDPTGWWLSEKLDGVRAYWDGRQFLSRQGNRFHAPDWFIERLPAVPLDGELWVGRKAFGRTMSIVRRHDQTDLWREIRYLVFDAPAVGGPFESRLAAMQELLSNAPQYLRVHPHERCQSAEHLREKLADIEALGGEGLMLRQPGSVYEAGRSATLLKIKTFHDAEAQVVAHLPGTGRHTGRMGALLVELPDGTTFHVGTGFSDAQRAAPPPVGRLITFRYQELTDRGVPRFPSFVRVCDGEVPSQVESPARAVKSSAPAAVSKRRPTPRPIVVPSLFSPSEDLSTMSRRFEFVAGSSAKFWEVGVSGGDVTVCFGRIGTSGQTQTKSFADAAAASRHADKLIGQKTAKGYVECAAC